MIMIKKSTDITRHNKTDNKSRRHNEDNEKIRINKNQNKKNYKKVTMESISTKGKLKYSLHKENNLKN